MRTMAGIRGAIILTAMAALLPAAAGSGESRPLMGREDAVSVRARELPAALQGYAVKSYRVLADTGDGVEAIPFQIDERDDKDLILVKQGPHPEASDGVFQGNDELFFMARDAGAPAPSSAPAGCARSAVVTVTDKKSGAAGSVTVAQCENPPPLTERDYVRIDPKTWTVTTESYRFGWHERLVFSYDYISVYNGPDTLDRLRVRCSIGKWGVFYTFDEDQFHYTLLGYNDGPIRVSWKADNYWSLGPLGKLPVPQHILFYADYLVMVNTMDVSMNPALIGLDMEVEIGNDMSIDKSQGYSICANVLPACRALDHKIPADSMKEFTERDIQWGGLDGPEGALMIHMVPDPLLNVRVKGRFAFDEDYVDPPEYVKGAGPILSFFLVNWKDVKPTQYDLSFFFYFMDK